MSLIDIGANLTHDSFTDDLAEVIQQARDEQIEKMIVTGASVQGSLDARNVARDYPGVLFSTAGIHPHHAEETKSETIDLLQELALAPEVKAIGETGLDFFRDFTPREQQIKSFEAHIELAIETGLPMFLHERDAHPTFANILATYRSKLNDVVVHCFTGTADALEAYIDMDCHIGITGWICDERRGAHLVPLLKEIPDNRLLIETDAPYLLPRTINPRPKTRRNEPKYLKYVCQFISDSLGQSFDDIAKRTSQNAMDFFRLSH
jgi:TatD DNase family protein